MESGDGSGKNSGSALPWRMLFAGNGLIVIRFAPCKNMSGAQKRAALVS